MVKKTKCIGVLALQGGFDAHLEALNKLDSVKTTKVTSSAELKKVDGLIIPGGESSTFLKLLDPELKSELQKCIKNNFPIFGTCAGLILLAKHVENPAQNSLEALDIDIKRNAYGRQLESFETNELIWENTKEKFKSNAIFIRAPKITRIGKTVEVLLSYQKQPVLIKSGKILGATFHPELNRQDNTIHQLFVDLV